jgi:bacteriocin biosynthesis cyclodehydratase domain-containing protein
MSFALPRIKRHFHLVRSIPEEASPSGLALAFHYGRERGVLLHDLDDLQVLLLSLLDGHHSFHEIVTQLQAHDAAVTVEDVAEHLDELARYGLLEEAQISPPAELTPTDLMRYDSQIRFFSVFDTTGRQRYEMQARLKRARVTVLGLGGLGSNIVLGLAAAGVGSLRGVDFDVVELGNLNRQVLYDALQVGQPKALAAAEQLRRFNPAIDFEPVQRRIESPESILEVIEGSDVVAFCADSPPSISLWMNAASLETGIPFIMGGYRGGVAEVGPFVVPFQTACLACQPQEPREHFPDALAWMNAAHRLRHPTSHMVSALAANLACSDLIKYLTGMGEPATYNNLYGLNIEQFTLTPFPLSRSEACVLCGSRATRSQRGQLLKHGEMSLA